MAFLQKRKKWRKAVLALSVLSLVVAVSTFRMLTLPAVTLTEDPNTMEASDPASSEASPSSDDAESTDEAAGDADAGTGTDPGSDAGNTPGTGPGSDAGNTPGTDPGPDAGNTPGTDPGSDAGNTPGTDPGSDAGNTPGTDPGSDAGNTPGSDPGSDAGNTPGSDPGSDAGTEKIPDPEIPLDGLTKDPEETEPSEYTYDDGSGLTVTAIPLDPTSIPEGAEFHADRITQESDPDRYAQLQQLLKEEGGLVGATGFSAYDICFLLDGQKTEPDGSEVSVTIVDTTDNAVAPEEAQVFHVLNEDSDPSLQELTVETASDSSADASDAAQGITFTTDSFSTFAVKPALPAGSQLIYRQVPSEEKVFTESGYYNASQPLGIAGNFSLVAFHTLYINADCNGNILTNTLTFGNGADFGTKNLPSLSEVSYVHNYPAVDSNGPRASDQLVLGSANAIDWTDGGDHFTINGHKVSQPTSLWQDYDTGGSSPFIDLQEVKNNSESLSARLAGIQQNDNIIGVSLVNTGDQTQSGVTLKVPDGTGVFNTTAAKLSNYSYCNVRGLTFNADNTALTGGTVIINVDCSGWNKSTVFEMPKCKIYPDLGDPLDLKEIATFTNGRVLWNFINCDGMTIETQLEYCSILAPGATIIADQNVNGTIIADNITINAESHRDDFVGELPKSYSYTVKKVWRDINGNELATDALEGWSVDVVLCDQDGNRAGDVQTLNNENHWTCTWSHNLDRSKTYKAVEIGVYRNRNEDPTNLIDQYTPTLADSGGIYTITNSPKTSYELPDTGGPGTDPYTAAGLSLLLLSSLLLWRKKRQGRDAG